MTANPRADVINSNVYGISTNGVAPSIFFNNSTYFYVIITLYNNQPVSTDRNFQMLIKVDWLRYTSYLNSECSNVRFYNNTSSIGKQSGYGVLPSWIETNDSNISQSSYVWINLSGTIIPANGYVNIYMAFLPKSVSWNSYLGLNPVLSPVYGEYDNGNRVFTQYWNFSGNKLPVGWIEGETGGQYHVNNGILIEGSNSRNKGYEGVFYDVPINPQDTVTDFYGYLIGTGNYWSQIGLYGSTSAGIPQYFIWTPLQSTYKLTTYNGGVPNMKGTTLTTSGSQTSPSIWSIWSSPSYAFASYNYSSPIKNNENFKSSTAEYIGMQAYSKSNRVYINFIRTREYPPNGIMPSYSFNLIDSHSLWHTKLNFYKDQAFTNITSIWSTGIFCDDNGNVFRSDTYGNVYVGWVNLNYAISYLGSPYKYFQYAGAITSIAAINYTNSNNNVISYVVLISNNGYVFAYNVTNSTWFNATSMWNLPLTQYPSPWTSVTANVEGYIYNYDEGFFFTDLSGNVYFFDITSPTNSQWYITSTKNEDIVSTVAYYNGNLYGLSPNGNVYVALSNKNWGIYDNTGLSDLVGITMDNNGYLYLLQLKNGTSLYQSSTTSGSISGTFSPYGSVVFSQGTNEGITYDQYNFIFWAIQTNGTIATDGGSNAQNWYFINNLLSPVMYPAIVALNTTYNIKFNAYSLLVNDVNLSSIRDFSLYFIGSSGTLENEFIYENGIIQSSSEIALLDNQAGLLINVTIMPNMAYNSSFQFYVIFYPSGTPNSILFEYILDINIINHFYYLPIS